MPWSIPTAKTIAERIAAAMENAISIARPLVDPVALSRAVRSARGMLAIIGRAVALELREVHDHLAWWGRQYFVDTAEEEFVLRHAAIWGVARRDATAALGTVTIEGVAAAVLPAGLELVAGNITLTTQDAVTIESGGTVSVSVSAPASAGTAGNIEAGVRLTPLVANPDITRVTVDAPGLTGGADQQTVEELAAAVVARIQQPPHGGAAYDYQTWLTAQFDVEAVSVVTDWIGRGSVGLVVAMSGPRAPSEAECEAMLQYLGAPNSVTGVRPVTARVVVVPAVLTPVDITVRVRPDTVATRAAIEAAFARYVATIGEDDDTLNPSRIGAIIEPSRISEALSAADDEWAHDMLSPAARYALGSTAYPVVGTISFEAE